MDNNFYLELTRRLRNLEQFLIDSGCRSTHFSVSFMNDGCINVFNDYFLNKERTPTDVSCLIYPDHIFVSEPSNLASIMLTPTTATEETDA